MTKAKLFIATAAALLTSQVAAAQSTFTQLHWAFVYYADQQRTEVVGYTNIYCDGTATGNGYPTPYYDEQYHECP